MDLPPFYLVLSVLCSLVSAILFLCSWASRTMTWRTEGGQPPQEGFGRLHVWNSIQSASSVTTVSLARCKSTINLVSGRVFPTLTEFYVDHFDDVAAPGHQVWVYGRDKVVDGN